MTFDDPLTVAEDRWLLPEGVEELRPGPARRLESLRRRTIDLFERWGYELIIPPLVEYLESLLTGTGRELDLQTFKLTDQLSGRLMGVRADMTPQAARIDAHLLGRDAPTRLCYVGSVLHTRPDGFSRSRSPIQAGAELFGHTGVESDVEVLSLMFEALTAAGLRLPVHLDLGHVGVFRGLVRQAGLPSGLEARLFGALRRKARPDLERLLSDAPFDPTVKRMLLELTELSGGVDVLPEARRVLAAASDETHRALDELDAVARRVARRLGPVPLYFDLAELRGYRYHTGVMFAAFVPGCGQEVARGGRYDDIGRVFGRARPATGFSMDLKTLLALTEAETAAPGGILAPAEDDEALDRTVRDLRARGERVVHELPGQMGAAADLGCDRCLVREGSDWRVVPAQ